MGKLKSNQRGFGAIEMVLVLVIVILLGVVGWFVYKNHHKTNDTSTTISTPSATPKTSTVIKTTPKALHTTTEAQTLVQTTYNTALAYVKKTTNADQGEIDSIKTNLSSSLYDKLSSGVESVDHDQIMCTQAIPNSVTVMLGSSSNGVAKFNVTAEFGGDTKQQIFTTVDLSTLKITNITCPV